MAKLGGKQENPLSKHPLTSRAMVPITCMALSMTIMFMGLRGLVDDPHVAKLLMGLCGLVDDPHVASCPRARALLAAPSFPGTSSFVLHPPTICCGLIYNPRCGIG